MSILRKKRASDRTLHEQLAEYISRLPKQLPAPEPSPKTGIIQARPESFLRKETMHMTDKNEAARQSKTGAAPAKGADATTQANSNNGLGFNGEFRVGKITLKLGGDGGIRLRKENEGSEVEVAEMALEGLIDQAYFVRQIDDAGNDTGTTGNKGALQRNATTK